MDILAPQEIATLRQTGSKKQSSEPTSTFPAKLHKMLDDAEENDFSDVVSWNNGGSSFKVHKPMEFSDTIMPAYFNQTKYKSFQRQVNLYAFVRIHQGSHKGSYTHANFHREDLSLSLLDRHKVTLAKNKPAAVRLHDHSNNLSSMSSAFDTMQAILDFEKIAEPIISSVWDKADSLANIFLEPTFNEACLSEVQLFKDFFETDDIASDAGDVLNDISNDPLCFQSMTNNDPKLLSVEKNKSFSGLIIDNAEEKQVDNVEEKQVEVSAKQTEHSFPWKLHDMLEEAERNNFGHIVSWEPDGVSFKVHKSDEFVTKIMPLYFDQTKYESFRRQLNLYKFSRVTRGSSRGMYIHASLVKGDRSLCKQIKRQQ
jgi:hypothetical protein